MGELPIAIANVIIGHGVWMWILPIRETGLARFKQGCGRAALIGVVMAVAYGITRFSDDFLGSALFGVTVVAVGAIAGGILSAIWRQPTGADSQSV